ncbi:hypothetical protein [Streptomyces sp. NPDC054863]
MAAVAAARAIDHPADASGVHPKKPLAPGVCTTSAGPAIESSAPTSTTGLRSPTSSVCPG